MKINVPFYKQDNPFNCGPFALRMVLSYLDKDYGTKFIKDKMRYNEGELSYTIQLANLASSLGFKTQFFSTSIYPNKENSKLDYYKKFSNTTDNQLVQYVKEAENLGVVLKEKSISLDELLSHLSEDSIPIILLDWSVIIGKKERGYTGHGVPLVGYDKENVYIHNQGANDTRPFFSIPKKVFDEARKSKGTDEDIIVIYRK